MKKVYTFALACGCVAMAANAASVQQTPVGKMESNKLPVKELKQASVVTDQTRAMDVDVEDITDWEDLGMGKFKDNIIGGAFSHLWTTEEVNAKVQHSPSNPGWYRVVNPWLNQDSEDTYLIIDARVSDCVIVPEQPANVGVSLSNGSSSGNIHFESVSYWYLDDFGSDDPQDFVDDEDWNDLFIVNYENSKCIYFAPGSSLIGFPEADDAFLDGLGVHRDRFYRFCDDLTYGYLILPGGKFQSPWKEIGEGTLVDGIFGQFFADETQYPSAVTYNVTIERNDRNTKQFRAVGMYPYLDESFAPDGVQPMIFEGNFEEDGTTVTMPVQLTGLDFQADEDLYGPIQICSWVGFPSVDGELTAQDVIDGFSKSFPDLTVEDVSILFDKASRTMNFGYLSVAYNWESAGSTFYAFYVGDGCSLELPETALSVENIAVDETNAPVEYYNIQGMRINNPQAGQLVIKRQGNKASKYIAK